MHTCPVCGYPGLRRPPADHLICPSCGTQFGYDDAGPGSVESMREKLRGRWIRNGAHWYSQSTQAPPYWNAWQQLMMANLMTANPARTLPYLESAKVVQQVEATETFGDKKLVTA